MAARALEPVDCSVQPLDFSFHPTMDILAAALVDGTVEVHDFSTRTSQSHNQTATSATTASMKTDDDDDEMDTILSSIPVHCNDIPKKRKKPKSTGDKSPNNNNNNMSTMMDTTQRGPSCRAVLFDHYSNNGGTFYTAGNGGTFACIDTERSASYHTSDDSILWKIDNASPHAITTLYQLGSSSTSNDNNSTGASSSSAGGSHAGPLVVSGDDEGTIRFWDTRICGNNNSTNNSAGAFDGLLSLPRGCVASFEENTDYITGFTTDDNENTLVASSADGTISIFDIRKSGGNGTNNGFKTTGEEKKSNSNNGFSLIRKSDDQEDELLSICKMKNGKKIVCGTQEGVLAIWSWGTWGDIGDRFPGHPNSIDALLKVDERTLLTGSSDGLVRVVELHPNNLLGVLGDHGGFPVEKLEFSAFKKTVGSLSHDNLIRLWDASLLRDDDDNNNEDDDVMDEDDCKVAAAPAVGVAKGTGNNSDDDWEDMDDYADSDDSMDDSDSDDGGGAKSNKRGKAFKSENDQFFEDL